MLILFKINYLQTCYFTNAGIDDHSRTTGVHQGVGLSSYFVVIKLFKLVLIDNY